MVHLKPHCEKDAEGEEDQEDDDGMNDLAPFPADPVS